MSSTSDKSSPTRSAIWCEKKHAPEYSTPQFWAAFAENNWEKEEFLLNDQSVPVPISEEELFEAVVGMAERQTSEAPSRDIMMILYIGQSRAEFTEGYYHLYPKREDHGFMGYCKRLELELDGQEFSFVIDGIEMPAGLKAWTYTFLRGMYRPINALSYGHFWSIFYGNYTTTVYGVHDHVGDAEAESAFYFPINGKKEMYTWRPDYVAKYPDLKDSRDYSKHKKNARKLSVDAGGMMYWPSDRWHIGSSKGGDISIVLGVRAFSDGVDVFGQMLLDDQIFNQYLRSRVVHKFGFALAEIYLKIYNLLIRYSKRAKTNQIGRLPFCPGDLQGSAAIIPLEVRKIVKPFSYLFGKNLERVMSVFWLVHLSTLGMRMIRPESVMPAFRLTLGTRLKRHTAVIVLWRQVDAETLIVVSEWHTHEVPVWFASALKHIVGIEEGGSLEYSSLMNYARDEEIVEFEGVLSDFVRFLVEARIFLVQ